MKYTEDDYTKDFWTVSGVAAIGIVAWIINIVKALSGKRYGRAAWGCFGMLVSIVSWLVSVGSAYRLKELCMSESDDESENTDKIEKI